MVVPGAPPTNLIRLAVAAKAARALPETKEEDGEEAIEGEGERDQSWPMRWVALGIMAMLLTTVAVAVTDLGNGSWLLSAGLLVVAIALLLLGFALGRRRPRRREAA